MADIADTVTALQKVTAARDQSAAPRFNTDLVRVAWGLVQRHRREIRDARRRAVRDFDSNRVESESVMEEDPLCYAYIEQLWTDHIIVKLEVGASSYLRIPYTVAAPGTTADNIKFGVPEPVVETYVAASAKRGRDALSQLLELRHVSPKERESLKGKGHTLPGTTSYPIKTMKDLLNAMQAFGRSKPEDRQRLKSHIMSEARRLGASEEVLKRIRALGQSSVKATASDPGLVALAQVRTQAGSRRYRKPIGAPLGSATGTAAPARPGLQAAGVTASKLRASLAGGAKVKPGKIFGAIKNEGSLKGALSRIASMPANTQGEAAAEVVKAAQALGLTALVPASVKRLYRQYIAQSTISQPSKASTVKIKK